MNKGISKLSSAASGCVGMKSLIFLTCDVGIRSVKMCLFTVCVKTAVPWFLWGLLSNCTGISSNHRTGEPIALDILASRISFHVYSRLQATRRCSACCRRFISLTDNLMLRRNTDVPEEAASGFLPSLGHRCADYRASLFSSESQGTLPPPLYLCPLALFSQGSFQGKRAPSLCC